MTPPTSPTHSRQTAAGSPRVVELRSTSLDATQLLGERLGRLLSAGDVVLLHGALGAGKTAFAQGIGRGLDVPGTINSPTFTLLKEYAGRLPFFHFDLYRIEDPAEVEALGFGPYFEDGGVSVVEWAERGEAQDAGETPWPANWLRVSILRTGERTRLLRCTAAGARGVALLDAFAAAAEEEAGS